MVKFHSCLPVFLIKTFRRGIGKTSRKFPFCDRAAGEQTKPPPRLPAAAEMLRQILRCGRAVVTAIQVGCRRINKIYSATAAIGDEISPSCQIG
jgi:hypothetical protein